MLELERQQHNQLKHTWQRANDQFLESQRLLMRDMQRIESVLSSEQLRQVEEMKRRDQVQDVPLCQTLDLFMMRYNSVLYLFSLRMQIEFSRWCVYVFSFFQEEDEKERLSQAQEAGEDDGADHTEGAEDSFLGISIEEVPKPQY